MVLKEQCFYLIMDIYVFCVIVNDFDICYCVLGQMYSLYKLCLGCVKDYIVILKVNGYQLLYILMIGLYSVLVEVQICIEDMDQMVEMGVVVYWVYKEYGEISIIV